jgi:hypothetical protein
MCEFHFLRCQYIKTTISIEEISVLLNDRFEELTAVTMKSTIFWDVTRQTV